MATSNSPPSNILPFIPLKLSRDNYLLWKAQFVPLLKGHGLLSVVDGTAPIPPVVVKTTTSDGEITEEINPTYTAWEKKDQMVLSWLISSLTEPLLPLIVGHHTAQAIWEALTRAYASCSRSRVLQL